MTEEVKVPEVELPVEADAAAVEHAEHAEHAEHVEHVDHDPAVTVHVDLVGGNGPTRPE